MPPPYQKGAVALSISAQLLFPVQNNKSDAFYGVATVVF